MLGSPLPLLHESPIRPLSLPIMLPASSSPDPLMMPRIQVDKGAIKFILGGANVMTPGVINTKGGAVLVDLPEGAPVAVFVHEKEQPIAIGTMLMSTADMCVLPAFRGGGACGQRFLETRMRPFGVRKQNQSAAADCDLPVRLLRARQSSLFTLQTLALADPCLFERHLQEGEGQGDGD